MTCCKVVKHVAVFTIRLAGASKPDAYYDDPRITFKGFRRALTYRYVMRHVADQSIQCHDGIRRHPNRARRRKPSVLGKAAGGFCLSATGGRLFFVSGPALVLLPMGRGA